MRFVVRGIAMMALALALTTSLYSNDAADPDTKEAKAAPAISAPAAVAKARQPNPVKPLEPPSANGPSPSAAPPAPAGKGLNFAAQDGYTPRVEWFLGYSYWGATPATSSNRINHLNGGSTSVAFNLNRYFGLVADFAGYGNSGITLNSPDGSQEMKANGTAYTYMFGPRFSFRRYEMLTPFVQALFGGAYATSVTISGCTEDPGCTPLHVENVFAAMFGAGLDIRITHHVALRLVEGDYLLTNFKDPSSARGQEPGWQNNIRISSGILFRFGGDHPPTVEVPPPNRPPMASCSADKNSVFAGSSDTIAVTTTASDPDGDPLTYSWTVTGGRVDGTGPAVRWLSAGVLPGAYSVTVVVSDGRGGTATCSVSPMVGARPNRPPTVTLTSDRDTVFAGERVQFTAHGIDPDNDPLTYTWRTNCGRLTAMSTSGTLDTTGVAPGTACNVTVRVEDNHGGAADASKAVNVIAPPAPPLASKLSSCDFKPATSARLDNVCKRILDDAGLRLQNEPRATVVVIAFAAPGRQAAKIAGDRAENTAKYLADKGVDRSRITKRTGQGEAGAGQANSRLDVIWVPEGATY